MPLVLSLSKDGSPGADLPLDEAVLRQDEERGQGHAPAPASAAA